MGGKGLNATAGRRIRWHPLEKEGHKTATCQERTRGREAKTRCMRWRKDRSGVLKKEKTGKQIGGAVDGYEASGSEQSCKKKR